MLSNDMDFGKLAVALGIGGFTLPHRHDNLRLVSLALASWGGWKLYQDHKLSQHPELMNGYFKTEGRMSALDGPAQAAAIREMQKDEYEAPLTGFRMPGYRTARRKDRP